MQIVKGLTYFEYGDLHRLSKDDKTILLKATKNINIAKIENILQNKSHKITPKSRDSGIEM